MRANWTSLSGTIQIEYCGVTCILVGYNTNSRDSVYRMWNPDTNRIRNTHDIIWLKRMFYQEKLTTGMVADVSDDENENDPQNLKN